MSTLEKIYPSGMDVDTGKRYEHNDDGSVTIYDSNGVVTEIIEDNGSGSLKRCNYKTGSIDFDYYIDHGDSVEVINKDKHGTSTFYEDRGDYTNVYDSSNSVNKNISNYGEDSFYTTYISIDDDDTMVYDENGYAIESASMERARIKADAMAQQAMKERDARNYKLLRERRLEREAEEKAKEEYKKKRIDAIDHKIYILLIKVICINIGVIGYPLFIYFKIIKRFLNEPIALLKSGEISFEYFINDNKQLLAIALILVARYIYCLITLNKRKDKVFKEIDELEELEKEIKKS